MGEEEADFAAEDSTVFAIEVALDRLGLIVEYAEAVTLLLDPFELAVEALAVFAALVLLAIVLPAGEELTARLVDLLAPAAGDLAAVGVALLALEPVCTFELVRVKDGLVRSARCCCL